MSFQSSASPTASEYPQFTDYEKDWMACMFYHFQKSEEDIYRALIYATTDRVIPTNLLRDQARDKDTTSDFLFDIRFPSSGADYEYFRRWNFEGQENLHPALHTRRDMHMARFDAGLKNYSEGVAYERSQTQ
ncbi:MAG: hypothetical protein Q9172_003929 [Xanthocarpia lactea]